jgi:hypothetical protein
MVRDVEAMMLLLDHPLDVLSLSIKFVAAFLEEGLVAE